MGEGAYTHGGEGHPYCHAMQTEGKQWQKEMGGLGKKGGGNRRFKR